jgi:IclR family acetate operon transcriptional repressor
LASSIQKTFRCIETIANSPAGLTVSEVAHVAGLSRPAATRLLDGLAADSIVVRDEMSKRYRLGLRLYEWAVSAVQASTPINIARKEVLKLAMDMGREFNLLVMEGADVVLLERFEDVDGIILSRPVPGRRAWYLTATGKAIVAFLPQARAMVDKALKSNGATPDAIGDLAEQLATVRERGYALSHDVRNQASIGVPVFGQSGIAVAAIGSFLAPDEDEAHLDALLTQMFATAERISHYLGHRTPVGAAFT